jgi:hypothetical protein
MAIAEIQTTSSQRLDGWQPPPVDNPGSTGLSHGFLADLCLKIMYYRGEVTGSEIAEEVKLPYQSVLLPIMSFLRREQLCEVTGSTGVVAASFEYVITTKGSTRAREQLNRSSYVGPAPVSWNQYVASVEAQGTRKLRVNPRMMGQGMSHLVLNERVLTKIGPAVNSGK